MKWNILESYQELKQVWTRPPRLRDNKLVIELKVSSARLADTRSFLVNTAIRLHNPLFNLSRPR